MTPVAQISDPRLPHHYVGVVGTLKPTSGVPYNSTFFEYVAGSSPLNGTWWIFTAAGWIIEPGASEYVHIHTITPAVVNPAAAQTDVITIDGVACSFTSDATPTAAEIVTGLQAAIAASAAAGKFVVSGTVTVILTPAGTADPVVSVSANLTDVQTIGTPILGISTLGASEARIGQVGGDTLPVVVTPVIGAAAFTAGDFVGGKLTLLNAGRVAAGSGIIQSLSVVDAAKQAAALRIYLFKADLAGTYADNAVESFTAADMLKFIVLIDVLATDWETLTNASVTKADTLRSLGIPYKITTGTSLFAIIRTLGTPTYTANCLQLTFGLLRD